MGAVLWTSIDLGTLGPHPVDGTVDPSTLALGQDDLVVTIAVVVTASGEALVASAFDSTTGALRWSTTLTGGLQSGPVIRPDGMIAALANTGAAYEL